MLDIQQIVFYSAKERVLTHCTIFWLFWLFFTYKQPVWNPVSKEEEEEEQGREGSLAWQNLQTKTSARGGLGLARLSPPPRRLIWPPAKPPKEALNSRLVLSVRVPFPLPRSRDYQRSTHARWAPALYVWGRSD